MDFSWIKRLFKIKSSTNSNDVGISTIDTSFIKVPKLSDLSKENQDKVMEYFNEIKYDNYETIVKYSDSLLEKSNREIDFFVHDLENSIKTISAILKEVNKDNYFQLLLYREEIKLSIEELNKIEQEAELRLIALDTYIKKEERRKYDFLGIFGKAERLRYLSDKSSLLNERQRLLITIKLNKQHLQIIYNTLNENKELLEAMNNYINKYKDFPVFNIYWIVREILLKEDIIGADFVSKELEELFNKSENFTLEALNINNMSSLIAIEQRKIKQYAYEHRNDYKEIIKEINEMVIKYNNLSYNNKDYLKNLNNFINSKLSLIRKYYVCYDYLNDNILDKIVKSFLKINFFRIIAYGTSLGHLRTLGLNHSKLNDELFNYISFNEWNQRDFFPFDIQDLIVEENEIKYYERLSDELLNKIEDKYNISLDFHTIEKGSKNKRRQETIKFSIRYQQMPLLFDILNDNFNFLNDYETRIINTQDDVVLLPNNYLIRRINISSIQSIADWFYLLKYLNIEKYNLNEFYNIFKNQVKLYNLHSREKVYLKEVIFKSYISKLEKEYDDRILVIPQCMTGFTKAIHVAIENKIGVYVSNLSMAITINDFLKINKEHNIKYLFINENIYNELIKNNYTINAKVIIVPDDVKYSELSSYLDRELEKGQNEEKVLSKVR